MKYEVIASGIFLKENGVLRELKIGEVIDDVQPQWLAKLRPMADPQKTFEVATPQEKPPKKKKAE